MLGYLTSDLTWVAISIVRISKVLMYLNMVHKTQKISILLENKFFSKKNLVFSPKSSIFARYLRH